MSFPKILIACPTYEGMSYCLDEFLTAVRSLTYKNVDILIADNSKDNSYADRIRRQGFNVIRYERRTSAKQTLVETRNLLRQKFLNGGYDHFFSVEQDVILTPNIIQELLKHEKEIISGVYYKFKEISEIRTYYPLLMTACDKEGNQILTDEPDCLIRDMYKHEVEEPKLMQVEAAGLGCMMIARKVLEKIGFRYDADKNAYDDMLFALDCKKAGFKIYADTGLKCRHLIEGKPEYQ